MHWLTYSKTAYLNTKSTLSLLSFGKRTNLLFIFPPHILPVTFSNKPHEENETIFVQKLLLSNDKGPHYCFLLVHVCVFCSPFVWLLLWIDPGSSFDFHYTALWRPDGSFLAQASDGLEFKRKTMQVCVSFFFCLQPRLVCVDSWTCALSFISKQPWPFVLFAQDFFNSVWCNGRCLGDFLSTN